MLRIHTHEIAHMWFGNLVTPPWWDDLWLKEAFATWGTPFSLTLFEPEADHELDAIRSGLAAMRLDSLAAVRAVREPIDRNEDIRNAYDSITYSKGMAVIRMMDSYFGAGTFRPALGQYIALYEDGIADSPAFFDVIGKISGEPRLTEAFRSFVEQKGVPRIDVTNVTRETEALAVSCAPVSLRSARVTDRWPTAVDDPGMCESLWPRHAGLSNHRYARCSCQSFGSRRGCLDNAKCERARVLPVQFTARHVEGADRRFQFAQRWRADGGSRQRICHV